MHAHIHVHTYIHEAVGGPGKCVHYVLICMSVCIHMYELST
jgi:hypothetical protein